MELALFDLDHTLLAGDSDYAWTQYLVDKGWVDAAHFERKNAEFFEDYKAGRLDIEAFLDFQLAPLAAHSHAELARCHEGFMQSVIAPMISDKARALVARHVEAGDLCALVTATNSFVTAPIARAFGLSHLIATIPAQENGEFTGKPRGVPSFREGKIIRVEAWLESLGLAWHRFEKTWFYSDSLNDLPLLSKVSHPVAVSPDDTLRAHAQREGWAILELHT